MRLLLSIVLFTVALGLQSQTHEVIYENTGVNEVFDMAFAPDTTIVIAGGVPQPYIMRLDTNGAVIKTKTFTWFATGEQTEGAIYKILIDSNSNTWVLGGHHSGSFIMKLNYNFDTLIYRLPIGEDVYPYYTQDSYNTQVYIDGDTLIVVSYKRGDFQDFYFMYRFDISSNSLNFIDKQSLNLGGEYTWIPSGNRIKIQDYWLVGGDGLTGVNSRGNQILADSGIINGNVCAASSDGYLYVEKNQLQTNYYRSYIKKYDDSWQISDEVELRGTTNQVPSYNSQSYVNDMIPTKEHGLIVSLAHREATDYSGYFIQLNPDDLNETYRFSFDTIAIQYTANLLTEKNGIIIGAQSISSGNSGLRLHKLHFPKVQTNTQFYLNVEESIHSETNNALKIYPNPTRDKVSVSWEKDEQVTIKVYGISGALFVNQEIRGAQTQLDISQLPAGVYIVAVRGKQTNQTVKLIKE